MNKKTLAFLERLFDNEIESALSHVPILYQTKSKFAQKLVEDGLIRKEVLTLPGRIQVVVEGYVLTDLGRYEYCSSC